MISIHSDHHWVQTPIQELSPPKIDPLEQPGGGSYNFQGYTVLSVRGTYANPAALGGETYVVPLQAPAPIGSSVTNLPTPSGPPGTNTAPPTSYAPGTPPTINSAYWPFGALGNPSNKYPPDLTTHGVSDNLYNPTGGFAAGSLPAGRDNGVLSYGGLMFFVDYGMNYAL